jgi:hypothetical protein
LHGSHELALSTRLERLGNHDVSAGNALLKEGGKFAHLGQLLLNEGNAYLARAQQLSSQGNQDKGASNNLRHEAADDIQEGLDQLHDGISDLTQANAESTGGNSAQAAGFKDAMKELRDAGIFATRAANDVGLANANGTSPRQAGADNAAAASWLARATYWSNDGAKDIQEEQAGLPDRD